MSAPDPLDAVNALGIRMVWVNDLGLGEVLLLDLERIA